MTDVSLVFRREAPGDEAGVRACNAAAFGGDIEGEIVDRLRGPLAPPSFVAEKDECVVAHLLFTPVEVRSDPPWTALAVGPMSVLPAEQRSGVGTGLMNFALEVLQPEGRLRPRARRLLPALRFSNRETARVPDEVGRSGRFVHGSR